MVSLQMQFLTVPQLSQSTAANYLYQLNENKRDHFVMPHSVAYCTSHVQPRVYYAINALLEIRCIPYVFPARALVSE